MERLPDDSKRKKAAVFFLLIGSLLMRILEEDKIGACSIENVKLFDVKEWAT